MFSILANSIPKTYKLELSTKYKTNKIWHFTLNNLDEMLVRFRHLIYLDLEISLFTRYNDRIAHNLA